MKTVLGTFGRTFDNGYERVGEIFLESIKGKVCDLCKEEKILFLSMNGPNDEFNVGCICMDCLQKIVNEQQ